MAKQIIFRQFTTFLQAYPKRANFFLHKPPMLNHKTHWPLSLCKILQRSYDQLLRKWGNKPHFWHLWHLYGHAQCMPDFSRTNQLYQIIKLIGLQNFRKILWPIFEKMDNKHYFWYLTTCLWACLLRRARFFPQKPSIQNYKACRSL